MEKATKRPPIGVMPKAIYDERMTGNRIGDILDAMERYSKEQILIPIDWIVELRDRLEMKWN